MWIAIVPLLCGSTAPQVRHITLKPSTLSLATGSETSFPASVVSPHSVEIRPSRAVNAALIWSSSNPGVATVDSTGKVKALSPGTAMIKASPATSPGISGTCQLTVHAMASYSDPSDTILALRFLAGSYTDSSGRTLLYRLYVPVNYDARKKYPLTLFLHGSGERGTDNISQLKNDGPGVLSDPDRVQNAHPSFVVCPQCPDGCQWGNWIGERWPASALTGLLSSLRQRYSIDGQRIYLTGLSLGGLGTWYLIARHPNLFAAAVPCSGAGERDRMASLVHTPVWACHGTADPAVPFTGQMPGSPEGVVGEGTLIPMLRAAGATNCHLKTVNGGGHGDGWIQAYTDMDIINWMFSQSREGGVGPGDGSAPDR